MRLRKGTKLSREATEKVPAVRGKVVEDQMVRITSPRKHAGLYTSVSAAASKISGTRQNGWKFFGLEERRAKAEQGTQRRDKRRKKRSCDCDALSRCIANLKGRAKRRKAAVAPAPAARPAPKRRTHPLEDYMRANLPRIR